jgi:hypothetical protein
VGQSASDAVNPLASMSGNVLRMLLIPGPDAGLLANQTAEANQALLFSSYMFLACL